MPLITKADLSKYKSYTTNAASILKSAADSTPSDEKFDIFLSHSYRDAQSVNSEDLLAIKKLLEDHNYKVYVDWINDVQLARDHICAETANVLKTRIKSCKSLLFATTKNSTNSKWMPWELGLKDGENGRAAILPVVENYEVEYPGQEYLGIYPFVKKLDYGNGKSHLWICRNKNAHVRFDKWLNDGKMPSPAP